jgi:hypothetical protein
MKKSAPAWINTSRKNNRPFNAAPMDGRSGSRPDAHCGVSLQHTPEHAPGLYLNPPPPAAVFYVDEETAIRARYRLDPVLPLSPGRADRPEAG